MPSIVDSNNNSIKVKTDIFDFKDLIESMVVRDVHGGGDVYGIGIPTYGRLSPPQSRKRTPCKSNSKRLMRRVSFADSVGLELASIRYMTEGRDTPPDLERFHEALRFADRPSPRRRLTPLFIQPIQEFGSFSRKLNENNVALESVSVANNVVSGVVKVKNLAYEKTVVVVYTTDGWKSRSTATCFYINALSRVTVPNHFDAFSFQLELAPSCEKVEFCVEYKCAGHNYWDNNCSRNYALVQRAVSPDRQ